MSPIWRRLVRIIAFHAADVESVKAGASPRSRSRSRGYFLDSALRQRLATPIVVKGIKKLLTLAHSR